MHVSCSFAFFMAFLNDKWVEVDVSSSQINLRDLYFHLYCLLNLCWKDVDKTASHDAIRCTARCVIILRLALRCQIRCKRDLKRSTQKLNCIDYYWYLDLVSVKRDA